MEWKCEIKGEIPSKKNSRILAKVRGRMINVPSKRYKDWHAQVETQLLPLLKGKTLPLFEKGSECELEMKIWFGSERRADCDNRLASVCDLLQDIGVLEDDDRKTLRKLTVESMGLDRENPRAEITLRKVQK